MFEVVINWETANNYKIQTEDGQNLGFAAERSKGFFHSLIRNTLRSHRPLVIDIWNDKREHMFIGERAFYFFFSCLKIKNEQEILLGEIRTRFGVLKRKYDILDNNGQILAQIESYRWRLWQFKILKNNLEIGVISKKWGGILKEVFTDADRFAIDLSKHKWTEDQKAILLFSTLCIDLDFFEDNSSSARDLLG